MPRGGVAARAVIAAMHRARRTQREPTTRDTPHRNDSHAGETPRSPRSPAMCYNVTLPKSDVRYQASPVNAYAAVLKLRTRNNRPDALKSRGGMRLDQRRREPMHADALSPGDVGWNTDGMGTNVRLCMWRRIKVTCPVTKRAL